MLPPISPINPGTCAANIPHLIQFVDDDWDNTHPPPEHRAHRDAGGRWHLETTDRWNYADDEVIVLRPA